MPINRTNIEKTASRITSLLYTPALDTSVTGLKTFELSSLKIPETFDFELPNNLRLGHLAERVVAELIRASKNYNILHEGLQITEGNNTVGELDFILQDLVSDETIHLELAYKFYLYDPHLSKEPINNLIGPNRNDSLREKLEKLKTKQFPLLFDERTAKQLPELDLTEVSQALCLLASLYVPFNAHTTLAPAFQKAVRGYYLDFDRFISQDSTDKTYYLPPKKEWGIKPAAHAEWLVFTEIESQLCASLADKRALLCWQNYRGEFSEFFVTWW